MRKIRSTIFISIMITIVASTPVFAGEWVKGASANNTEVWSYKEGEKWLQNDYVFEGGEGLDTVAYYIGPCGTMVTNNYAPNGVWIGEDGKLQYHNGYRVTDVHPDAAVYGWDNGHDYIAYSFYYYDDYSDGFSIANVEAYYTSKSLERGFFLQYNLVKLGNGCFALCDTNNTSYEYYLSVSEDGSKLYITDMDGATAVYNYLEALYYS